MKSFITILTVFLSQIAFSQYKQVPLTKDESKSGILCHYEIADNYASAHLYILLGKKFRFENYTCLTSKYSEGSYSETTNEIIFTSTLQNGTLPVKVEYRKRAPTDSLVKRVAFIQDTDGREVNDGIIYINNDSTSCIYGDYFCSKPLNSIDSIKIVLTSGVSSAWVKVQPESEIIQVKILFTGEIEKYVIYNGRFRKDGSMLEPIFQ
jgi:hypothetical protein